MSLRASGGIDGRTHYHGCWRDHHDCAVRLLEDAAAALEQAPKRVVDTLATWFDEDYPPGNTHEMLREEFSAWLFSRVVHRRTELTDACARDVLSRIRADE